jgi:hypothetical protein
MLTMALLGAVGRFLPLPAPGVHAQIPAVKYDVRGAKGLVVTPFYEGWYDLDGTKYVMFGYYNRNTEEVVDVPIGPQNQVTPGPADQGQPTHFVPGLYYGVFVVAVPKDQPKAEVTWTLTANGHTTAIPAILDNLYVITPQRENGGAYPTNTPPVIKFDPSGASGQGPSGISASRTAAVGRPLDLDIWVSDDGLPPPPKRGPSRSQNPQGLALSWQVYRGSGAVKFSDAAPVPEQGKIHTTVTFSQPGEYVLHLLAVDSRTAARCCWTNAYIRVTVEGGAPGR